MRIGTGEQGRGAEPARALFFVEYGLGHKTHLRFLERHLAGDPRFDETIIPLYWLDRVGDLLGKLQIPPLRERGLDFFTWWVFQFKRQQVGYLLRRFDPRQLDLVYIHTQTAATSVLDLPRSVPAVVSIDLTWKLAFQESRYISSPLFQPTLELERRIFERSDLVVSFSDWAAASVIDDYKIPASKVRVVRNGVTLPPPAGEGAEPALVGAGVADASAAFGRQAGGNGLAPGSAARLGDGYGRSLRAFGANLLVGNGNGNGYGNGNGNGHGNGHGLSGGATNGLGVGPGSGHGDGHHPEPDPNLLKLGFIGNGFARKGGDLLLRVHQEHFADKAHLTLVCGDVPKQISGLRNVRLRSEVPWDELMSTVLPGLDLFVFPTRFDYSPYAVIEAMTAGLPVISTRVGAIPEMVQDGETGFLIEADREAALIERMDWALSNRSELPGMGARGRERAADHYAAERTYPQLLDLLASYAGRRVEGPRARG